MRPKFRLGKYSDYRHFSSRRRQDFEKRHRPHCDCTESEWPVLRRRFGTRPSHETIRRAEELRRRRDRAARNSIWSHHSSHRAARSKQSLRTKRARQLLLVPWQCELPQQFAVGSQRSRPPSDRKKVSVLARKKLDLTESQNLKKRASDAREPAASASFSRVW
jgi:hypothetical protein